MHRSRHDSIAIFAVDGRSGMLTVVGWEGTQGRTPRYFGLDPSGTHVYAANQNSNSVVLSVSTRQPQTDATGQIINAAVRRRLCFR